MMEHVTLGKTGLRVSLLGFGGIPSQRVTAETLWINTPGGTDLPVIVLEEGE